MGIIIKSGHGGAGGEATRAAGGIAAAGGGGGLVVTRSVSSGLATMLMRRTYEARWHRLSTGRASREVPAPVLMVACVLQVGDNSNNDSCGSLACIGETSGVCQRKNGPWSDMKSQQRTV
jgi:hypothetical protein